MPPNPPRRRAGRLTIALLAMAMLAPVAARGQGSADHVDIATVAVEGATQAQCGARVARVVEQARVVSLSTTPPYDLAPGLRTFYDQTLRLDEHGELASVAQLSTVYVTGYGAAGERFLRAVSPFVRIEVSRPAGTPLEAPSRISVSWLWLQRLVQRTDPAGRVIERPYLHRFDFVGEMVRAYGTWGHATAPCRPGTDGLWLGAVAVWTYLPP